MRSHSQIATLASGCFWCTEALLKRIKGVSAIISGYSDGSPGWIEAVQLSFDELTVSFENLLKLYFKTFDPTQIDQQGYDTGPQYRSAIFYHNENQKKTAQRIIAELNTSGNYEKPIATLVIAYTAFKPAEDYHQNFYENNRDHPYCKAIIDPKLYKLFSIHGK